MILKNLCTQTGPQGKIDRWNEYNDLLKGIKKDISFVHEEEDTIKSIPDIWSNYIIFESMLLNNQYTNTNGLYQFSNEDHIVTSSQWKGLLAVIALRQILDIPLTFTEIKLKDKTRRRNGYNQVDEETETGGLTTFERVIKRLPFERRLFNIEMNDSLYIIKIGKAVIGSTSSSTLVYKDLYHKSSLAGIENLYWIKKDDSRYFEDPVKVLEPLHKQMVAAWLIQMSHSIHKYAEETTLDSNHEFGSYGLLRDKLKEFIHELGYDIKDQLDNKFDVTDEIQHDFYNIFNTVVTHASSESDLVMSGIHQKDQLIILGESFADKKLAAIKVTGNHLLKRVPYDAESKLYNKDFVRQEFGVGPNYDILSESELLNETIFYLRVSSTPPKVQDLSKFTLNFRPVSDQIVGDAIQVYAIPPINELLLKHMKSTDVLRALTITSPTPGKIIVTLELQLKGGMYKFTKIYEAENCIEVTQIPSVGIWPNVNSEAPDWKLFYTYISNHDNVNQDCFMTTTLFEGYHNELQIDHDNKTEISADSVFGVNKTSIYKTNRRPRVLKCQYYSKENDFESHDVCNAGFLFLKDDGQFLPQAVNHARVSLDFGTSSTIIHYQMGNAGPIERLPIENNIFQVLSSNKDFINYVQEFIPLGNFIEKEFLSQYHLFKPDSQGNKPLIDGHVYYIQNRDLPTPDGILSNNMKWNNSDNYEIMCMEGFIKQIFMQVNFEMRKKGVRHIEWTITYPTSGKSYKRAIQTLCENAALIGSDYPDMDFKFKYVAEGLATAGYFHQEYNHDFNNCVTIDIGGGSSDIAIWHNGKYLLQSSLIFAGRTMFLEPLQKYLSSGEAKGSTAQSDMNYFVNAELEEIKKEFLDKKSFRKIETILSHKGEIFRYISSQTQSQKLEMFLSQITFSFASLMYYAGIMTCYLKSKGEYNSEVVPTVYLGGKGSHLLDWCNKGLKFESNPDDLIAIFDQVFKFAVDSCANDSAASLRNKIEIIRSKKPKSETGMGALINFGEIIVDSELRTKALAGLPYIAGDGQYGSFDTPTQLYEAESFDVDFQSFDEFMNFYNDITKDFFPAIKYDSDLIRSKIEAHLRTTKKQPTTIRNEEPLFILVVKSIIEKMNNQ